MWVYSRRGRGGSGDGPDYALEREVDDVLAVLAAAGDRPHLFGHSGGAMYAVLAAMKRPSLRSLVLYEPPLHLDRLDTTVVDDMQDALDADKTDRALGLLFPVIGVVDAEVQVLQSLDVVWERLRAGVRLVAREVRAGLEEIDRPSAFDSPDIPCCTSTERQRTPRSSRRLTRLPNCSPMPSSRRLRGSGTSPSPSMPRR